MREIFSTPTPLTIDKKKGGERTEILGKICVREVRARLFHITLTENHFRVCDSLESIIPYVRPYVQSFSLCDWFGEYKSSLLYKIRELGNLVLSLRGLLAAHTVGAKSKGNL